MGFVPILQTQYRLSRPYSGGSFDQGVFNQVILFTDAAASAKFIEGFRAKELIVEGDFKSTWSFRKMNLNPQMLYENDWFRVIGGSGANNPLLRYQLSLNPFNFGLAVNEYEDVQNCRWNLVDASVGSMDIWAYNNVTFTGSHVDIYHYRRDVRRIPMTQNKFQIRNRDYINANPEPDRIAWRDMEFADTKKGELP